MIWKYEMFTDRRTDTRMTSDLKKPHCLIDWLFCVLRRISNIPTITLLAQMI